MNTVFNQSAKLNLEAASFEVKNLSGVINHKYLEGKIKEIALNKIISPFLPNQFGVGTGKVCDSRSFISREIDLILYSKRLITPKIFEYNFGLYPIESVLTCIEVKSVLTKKELKKTFDSFNDILLNAKINAGFFGPKDQNLPIKGIKPTLEIFAFNSDLKESTDYAYKEFDRFKHIDSSWDKNPTIRSICILDKGWWIFWKSHWHFHPSNNKKETISYLSNTLNTLPKIELSRGNPRIGEYLTDIKDLVLI